jgi:hypothetical protein
VYLTIVDGLGQLPVAGTMAVIAPARQWLHRPSELIPGLFEKFKCTIVNDGLGQLPVAGTMAVIVNKEEEGQGAGVSEVIFFSLIDCVTRRLFFF